MADVIIKPTRDDFYLIYSTVSGAPHTWGSRDELEDRSSDIASQHLDTAELYGSSEAMPRKYGWDQQYLMIDTRFHNRRPHDQLCDDAAPYVEREKLHEFCQSWEPKYQQFMPPPGVVTWRCDCDQPSDAMRPRQAIGTDFPLVVVESPYAASDLKQRQEYDDYARTALKDCLDRGEAPFASHMLYAQPDVLNDDDPIQRARGIAAGFAWMKQAHIVAVYTDLGISPGMVKGIHNAQRNGIAVEFRTLYGARGE